MKWVNHIIIAAATTAVINPMLVPVAVLGSTAPDWLEWTPALIGRKHIRHRTTTHYLVYWIAALAFFTLIGDVYGIGAAFAWGGLSHVLCDALTAHGVPVGWWSDRRFHIFGGRLKTGMLGEYWVAGGVVVVCFVVASMTNHQSGSFSPYFFHYGAFYDSGLLDAKEWRDNRWVFF